METYTLLGFADRLGNRQKLRYFASDSSNILQTSQDGSGFFGTKNNPQKRPWFAVHWSLFTGSQTQALSLVKGDGVRSPI